MAILEHEPLQEDAAQAAPAVTVVCGASTCSLDHYARSLAARVGGHVLEAETDIPRFNAPPLGASARRALRDDLATLRRLRGAAGLVHLTTHHLARFGPFLRRPYVVTVHDLIRQRDRVLPEPLIARPNARDRALLALERAGIRRAHAVIAVSQSTRRELVAELGVAAERIAVVYEGVDRAVFHPVAARPLADPYVLFVGSEQPRKNLERLLSAFARLKAGGARSRLKLVKVGLPGPGMEPQRRRLVEVAARLGIAADVVFADRVPDEELAAYYAGAECLALPSLAEGFGLPPLEAMACGCPVVASSAGALPEVVGDAAVLVEPHEEAAIADALRRVLDEPALADVLRRRGLERAERFSWEGAADRTAAVYAAVAAGIPASET